MATVGEIISPLFSFIKKEKDSHIEVENAFIWLFYIYSGKGE